MFEGSCKLAYHLPDDCSWMPISQIIHDELHYHKVSANRVQTLFAENYKSKCLATAICFEELHREEGDDPLVCIVTREISKLLK